MGDVNNLIKGILVTKMLEFEVPNGNVLRALRSTDEGYVSFAEAYFSEIYSGAIKAWKRHRSMTLNLLVPIGEVKFAFTDGANSFKTITIGRENYCRLTVPPGIWFGFKGMKQGTNLIMNISDILHNPLEVDRLPEEAFAFDWS